MLNKSKQDSKELSPRSLNKMLLKRQVKALNCLNSSNSLNPLKSFVWFSNMSELVQIQYNMNCYNSYDSQTCMNMFKHV